MNANEAITKIKVMLGLEAEEATAPEVTVENVEFAEAELVDGTIVRVDGDFEVGKSIFVVTEEGDVPAPDGAHETVDGLIVSTEGGVIVSIEEKAPEAEGEEPAAEETVVVEEASAEFSEDFVTSLVETLQPTFDKIEALKADLESLRNEFSDLKEEPATKKITNNLKDYRVNQKDQHEARFAALRQIRNNK